MDILPLPNHEHTNPNGNRKTFCEGFACQGLSEYWKEEWLVC